MVGDDGDIVSLDDPSNKDKAQDFLKYFLKFGKMRQRKVKKELESYTIANNSSFGWMTESIYNQADIFKSGGDLFWLNLKFAFLLLMDGVNVQKRGCLLKYSKSRFSWTL